MVRVRAAVSLLVLALFPVVVLGVLAGVVATGLWVGSLNGAVGAKVAGWLAVPLLAALWIAVRDAARARPQPSRAPELSRADHPRLWSEVHDLAAGVQTAPPARIVVEPVVDASVTEAAGQREMVIGLPLLLAMDRAQLRAVLAHELGHYGGGHTRLAAMSYRASDTVLRTVEDLPGGPARWLLGSYARVYLAVAAWANRSQEREADDYAARVAGSQAAASALRRLLVVDAAWDALVEDYLPLGGAARRRPALAAGLSHLLEARQAELEEAVRAHLAEGGPQSVYDSHPPASERIARLAGLAGVPGQRVPAAQQEPAWTLLGEGRRSLAALEEALLQDGVPADWDELVELAGARVAADGAGQLARSAEQAGVRPPVTLRALLEAVERGEGGRIVAALVDPGVHPEERAHAERVVLTEFLTAAVTHRLCAAGRAVHRVDWTGPWVLCDPATGHPVEVEPLVGESVAEPTAVPRLRERLEHLGADLGAEVEAVAEPEAELVAAATQVRAAEGKERSDLLVCTTGVLLLPARPPSRWGGGLRSLTGAQRRSEEAELEARAEQGVDALRQLPDARWVDTAEVVAGRLQPRPYGWLLRLRLLDGSEVRIRSTGDTRDHADPLAAVLELLGARAGGEARATEPA